MDPESKKLLQDTFALSQENNSILCSMRRSQRITHFMSYIYWIFIIGSAVGAYYFIQPYIDQTLKVFNGAKTNLDSFNSLLNSVKK